MIKNVFHKPNKFDFHAKIIVENVIFMHMTKRLNESILINFVLIYFFVFMYFMY